MLAEPPQNPLVHTHGKLVAAAAMPVWDSLLAEIAPSKSLPRYGVFVVGDAHGTVTLVRRQLLAAARRAAPAGTTATAVIDSDGTDGAAPAGLGFACATAFDADGEPAARLSVYSAGPEMAVEELVAARALPAGLVVCFDLRRPRDAAATAERWSRLGVELGGGAVDREAQDVAWRERSAFWAAAAAGDVDMGAGDAILAAPVLPDLEPGALRIRGASPLTFVLAAADDVGQIEARVPRAALDQLQKSIRALALALGASVCTVSRDSPASSAALWALVVQQHAPGSFTGAIEASVASLATLCVPAGWDTAGKQAAGGPFSGAALLAGASSWDETGRIDASSAAEAALWLSDATGRISRDLSQRLGAAGGSLPDAALDVSTAVACIPEQTFLEQLAADLDNQAGSEAVPPPAGELYDDDIGDGEERATRRRRISSGGASVAATPLGVAAVAAGRAGPATLQRRASVSSTTSTASLASHGSLAGSVAALKTLPTIPEPGACDSPQASGSAKPSAALNSTAASAAAQHQVLSDFFNSLLSKRAGSS